MDLLLFASSDLEPLPFEDSSEGTPLFFLRLPPEEVSLADSWLSFFLWGYEPCGEYLPATFSAAGECVYSLDVCLTASYKMSATVYSTTLSTMDKGPFGELLSFDFFSLNCALGSLSAFTTGDFLS